MAPDTTNDPTNPIGLNGFEFVEFTSPDPHAMIAHFERLGFTANARHPSKNIVRYKQGRINLLLNLEPTGQAAEFRSLHGPSASGMAFRVADPKAAFGLALSRGAKAVDATTGALGKNAYVLQGIGGSYLYLTPDYAAGHSL